MNKFVMTVFCFFLVSNAAFAQKDDSDASTPGPN